MFQLSHTSSDNRDATTAEIGAETAFASLSTCHDPEADIVADERPFTWCLSATSSIVYDEVLLSADLAATTESEGEVIVHLYRDPHTGKVHLDLETTSGLPLTQIHPGTFVLG